MPFERNAFEQILREQRDDIVVLTLNRPERMNAWTPRMTAELSDAIQEADAEPGVGAVVVTGAGRGFCAGADIEAVFDAQIQGDQAAGTLEDDRDWIELIRSTKPIVAAVNGAAIGLGLTMILPFDRIVVAEDAKLSVRFVQMGLVPELASSLFLPLRCGWGAASDLMLSGRTILGSDAVGLGLADEVAPRDEVLEVALERARSYAANPTPQLRWIKQLLTSNVNETDTRAVQIRELKALQKAYATTEHQEAVAKYLGGRKGT
ncbi:MAG TPA: enoyl-CoA hydratase/isomerase family protein [Microthrixaceae bacterium]|nr:enoyl-CoA hydratase/isomerase family protein [Microthrixaceae bacterium]